MRRRITWVLLACGVAVVAAGLLGVPSWVRGTRAAAEQVPQKGPELLKHVAPTVPEELRGTQLAETVGLQLVIGPDGKVVASVVFTPSTPLLARAAADAVKQWEYRPTVRRQIPVYALAYATVYFEQ